MKLVFQKLNTPSTPLCTLHLFTLFIFSKNVYETIFSIFIQTGKHQGGITHKTITMSDNDLARRTVFVTNVTNEMKKGNVEEMFALVGRVELVKEQFDTKTGGFGYLVEYKKEQQAKDACARLAGQSILGQKLELEYMGKKIADGQKEAEAQRRAMDETAKLQIKYRSEQTAGEQLETLMKLGVDKEVEDAKITEPCYFCKSMRHKSIDCKLCPKEEGASSSEESSSESSSESRRKRKRKKSSKKSKKDKRSSKKRRRD